MAIAPQPRIDLDHLDLRMISRNEVAKLLVKALLVRTYSLGGGSGRVGPTAVAPAADAPASASRCSIQATPCRWYLQAERDLSITGMYIRSRQHLTRTARVSFSDHPGPPVHFH